MKAGDDAGASPKGTLAPGLYLVATPIGNLEDITLRAVRVLKEADVIACEDTRQTQKLLNYYGITTRMASYHEHNEMTRAAELVLDLEGGARVALVTDAGMPGISDPGFRLISLAIRHHIPVVPIPGASAFLAALVASGLPTDSFRFGGFLPPKSGQRRQMLESVKASPRTQVFYEAPHRVKEAVEDIVEILGGDRHVVVAREVTKIHEEFLRGRASEVLEVLNAREDIKGEMDVDCLAGSTIPLNKDNQLEVMEKLTPSLELVGIRPGSKAAREYGREYLRLVDVVVGGEDCLSRPRRHCWWGWSRWARDWKGRRRFGG